MIDIFNLKSDGYGTDGDPAITAFGYEGLGDNADEHRWRAWWEQNGGIRLCAYPVVRATPCGAWIDRHAYYHGQWVLSGDKKFVHNESGMAWAKPTQEDAIKSIAIRLCRWTARLNSEVDRAKNAAMALDKMRPDFAQYAMTARINLNEASE